MVGMNPSGEIFFYAIPEGLGGMAGLFLHAEARG